MSVTVFDTVYTPRQTPLLNHAVVTQLGAQYQPAPLYNAAFVSGIHHGQGVIVSI